MANNGGFPLMSEEELVSIFSRDRKDLYRSSHYLEALSDDEDGNIVFQTFFHCKST